MTIRRPISTTLALAAPAPRSTCSRNDAALRNILDGQADAYSATASVRPRPDKWEPPDQVGIGRLVV